MTVLGLFGPTTRSLSLTEIADQLGMYQSSTHRLLLTLEGGGFLARSKESGRYRLGPRIVELADQAIPGFDVRDLARPHMRDLVHEFRESVALGYYDDGSVVYIEMIGGTQSLNISARIGARHPAPCVASGRAILAHLPDEVERLIAAGLPPCGPGLSLDAAKFRREIQAVQRRGYSIDDSTFMEGVRAVSSAIMDHDDRPVAALTVVAFSARFPKSLMREAGKRTLEVAEAISAELRHDPA